VVADFAERERELHGLDDKSILCGLCNRAKGKPVRYQQIS
jgi:hypothetical protein